MFFYNSTVNQVVEEMAQEKNRKSEIENKRELCYSIKMVSYI